jgi:hypothetical protein
MMPICRQCKDAGRGIIRLNAYMDTHAKPINGIYPNKYKCPICHAGPRHLPKKIPKTKVVIKRPIKTKSDLIQEKEDLTKLINELGNKIAEVIQNNLEEDIDAVFQLSELHKERKNNIDRMNILDVKIKSLK